METPADISTPNEELSTAKYTQVACAKELPTQTTDAFTSETGHPTPRVSETSATVSDNGPAGRATEEQDVEAQSFQRSLTELSTWSEQSVHVPVHAEFFRMETPADISTPNEELSTAKYTQVACAKELPTQTTDAFTSETGHPTPRVSETSATVSDNGPAGRVTAADANSFSYTKQASIQLVSQKQISCHSELPASLPEFSEKSEIGMSLADLRSRSLVTDALRKYLGRSARGQCAISPAETADEPTVSTMGMGWSQNEEKWHLHSASTKSGWTLPGTDNMFPCIDVCVSGIRTLMR